MGRRLKPRKDLVFEGQWLEILGLQLEGLNRIIHQQGQSDMMSWITVKALRSGRKLRLGEDELPSFTSVHFPAKQSVLFSA